MKKNAIYSLVLCAGILVGASLPMQAQQNSDLTLVKPAQSKILVNTDPNELLTQGNGLVLIREFDDGKVVKNVPFAAEFESESVRTLGDGNRIVKRSTSAMYRDNDGRTRREQDFNGITSFYFNSDTQNGSNNQEKSRQITIFDPIANINYSLNSTARTAFRRKLSGADSRPLLLMQPRGQSQNLPQNPPARMELRLKTAQENIVITRDGDKYELSPSKSSLADNTQAESLGTANIAGVEAEGKRLTTKIPAGKIGNERDIEIVSETWFSKEFGFLVKRVTKNPLNGDTTYTLAKFTRGEQPRNLFEVPADYKISDSPFGFNFNFNFPTNKQQFDDNAKPSFTPQSFRLERDGAK